MGLFYKQHKTMQRLLFKGLFLCSMVFSNQVFAEQLRIEFSGTFLDFCSLNLDCQTLTPLLGQPFSVEVRIPAITSLSDAELIDENFPFPQPGTQRALYQFDSPSFISVYTGNDAVDLFGNTPVTVEVLNCRDIVCAPADDRIIFSVITQGFLYSFTLAAPTIPLQSVEIPSLEVLQTMSAGFSIDSDALIFGGEDQDFFGVFSDDAISMTAQVSIVPQIEAEDDDDFILRLVPSIISSLQQASTTE